MTGREGFAVAAALAQGRIGVWWMQPGAEVIDHDAGMARLLGLEQQAGSLSINALLDRLDAQERDALRADMEALSQGRPSVSRVFTLRLGDAGGTVSVLMRLGLVDAPDQAPLLVACCQDSAAYERLDFRSTRDALTGLYSRHYFDLLLEREWRISMRERRDLSLVFIDLLPESGPDDDAVAAFLQRLGQLLPAAVFRPADLAARYAEARLALLLPGTDAAGAGHVARRMDTGIRGDTAIANLAPANRILMNIGVGCLDPSATAMGHEVLLARTETAVRVADMQGGDRVEIWQSSMPEVPPDWL